MKLLLDQNLSRRLLADIEPLFPGSKQVALCGTPPKILRLNMGNVSNARTTAVLLAQASGIHAFLQDALAGILEIE